jgi:hypothetical protein
MDDEEPATGIESAVLVDEAFRVNALRELGVLPPTQQA